MAVRLTLFGYAVGPLRLTHLTGPQPNIR